MTLSELAVAMSIMVIVFTVGLGGLVAVQRSYNTESDRAQTNDQGRLALEELQREIVSGNVLYDPGAEAAPYSPNYSLRIYTQSNANTRTPGYQCVQWVISGGSLLRRSYPEGQPTLASDWRTIATGIVNQSLSPPVPAFMLSTDPQKGYPAAPRTMDIVLMAKTNASSPSSSAVRLETSVTGRDTAFGFPRDPCPAPASI
ncbi:MAG: PilW family protein [Actinomycetota bacterium]